MLNTLITSKTRINLLLKFFLNPGTKAYLRELSAEFGESTNSVRVELRRLSEAKLITSEKIAWAWIIGLMLVMGGASHILVEASLSLGNMLGIDGVIMGFVVIAAGTSVPDTALSVISARKGQYDAAISNVFGSNIFDICICLSIPILLALAISGETTNIDLPLIFRLNACLRVLKPLVDFGVFEFKSCEHISFIAFIGLIKGILYIA